MADSSNGNGNNNGFLRLFLAQLPWVIAVLVSLSMWAGKMDQRLLAAERQLSAVQASVTAMQSEYVTRREAELLVKAALTERRNGNNRNQQDGF